MTSPASGASSAADLPDYALIPRANAGPGAGLTGDLAAADALL